MRAVVERVQFVVSETQRRVVRECPQQLVVARAGLVYAGEDRVDDAQTRRRADALRRQSLAAPHAAVSRRRMLECARPSCAYWIGRPWRARPAQIASGVPSKRSDTRRGWPSRRSTAAESGPRRESIARFKGRRRRSVLGSRAVIARAEHDGGEPADVVRGERAPAGEPHFDRATARHVLAAEAGG